MSRRGPYHIKVVNKGWFKPGDPSYNKGRKGIHPSRKTEFKKGNFPGNGKPVGSIYLNSVGRYDVKVAHPNMWRRRAHVVWELNHGPIPKGMLVHHIDHNSLNDDISNLTLLSRAEHLLIHKHQYEVKRKRLASKASRKRWEVYRYKQIINTHIV